MLMMVAVLPYAAAGSVRYDAEKHKPRPSAGCGRKTPYERGETTVAHAKYAGVKWTFRVYVPKSYDEDEPLPLILQHPGWGLDAKAEEAGAGITALAEDLRFISVTPQGMNDNEAKGGPWYSWNAVGSTDSPGPAGPTCTDKANHPKYCYESCDKKARRRLAQAESGDKPKHESYSYDVNESYSYGAASYGSYESYGGATSECEDTPQCWWTTCDETVTPSGTGTRSVGGFIPGLYDTLEEQLCIDLTREYASGESNGGMQTYQLGVDLAKRLAAITPEFGSFHRGFAMAPSVGVPVLDLHGSKDTTVPANVSLSADGWYYTTTEEIFEGGDYSKGWKAANECKGKARHWPTKFDGKHNFYCLSEGECSGGDVIRCMWDGGHNWLFNEPKPNGELLTSFLLEWTKPTHAGFGYADGEAHAPAARPLTDVQILGPHDASPNVSAAFDSLPRTLEPMADDAMAKRSHYGYPFVAAGCRADEEAIVAATGRTCAPKISTRSAANGTAEAKLPVPQCQLGGGAPHANGCPVDAPVSPKSKAWPVCLAKSPKAEADPYTRGDFHCLLVCPCVGHLGADCGREAHAHCPRGARCERGELRNRAHGVCTYHSSA